MVDVSTGWYIRGDIGYAHLGVDDVDYFQGAFLTGSFEQHDLDNAWTLQGGIGYQVTDYARVDLTLKHVFSSDFSGSSAPAGSTCNGAVPGGTTCEFIDNGELEAATILMANGILGFGNISWFHALCGRGLGWCACKVG